MKKFAIKIEANLALQGYELLSKLTRKGKQKSVVTIEAKDIESAHKKVTQHIPDELRDEPYKLVEL